MLSMRRALRHLFTILSAISLLLCVATCVLWVRSYWLGGFGEFIGLLNSRTVQTTRITQWNGVYSSHGCIGAGNTRQQNLANEPNFIQWPDGKQLRWERAGSFELYPFQE